LRQLAQRSGPALALDPAWIKTLGGIETMIAGFHNSESSAGEAALLGSPRSQLAEVKKFCLTSLIFIAGFIASGFILDASLASYQRHHGMRGGLGGEVQLALEHVENRSDAVRVIFLGDSVSRQLFLPSTEPDLSVRFLTTNQAISMAGQAYLAQNAFRRCPHITDVYLFYLPAAWENNLPREYTHDYFCGHFHSTAQVIEVFKMKRDFELSTAHLGRWFWPHIMAANTLYRPRVALRQQQRQAPPDTGLAPPPPDPERLLTTISGLMEPAVSPEVVDSKGQLPVTLSPVSRYYLAKLRQDCQSRGVRLHVLPCPVSTEKNRVTFIDPAGVYDAPIIEDVPAADLVDMVHFKKRYIEPMRKRMIRMYHLEFLTLRE
jgi:hypothetical protein